MTDTVASVDGTPRTLGVELRVREVRHETSESVSITFDATPESHSSLRFRPGQFLTLRIPSDRTGSVARCYSLASAPSNNEHLRIAVKRTVDGYGSNWLCDNVSAGMTLRVLPPAGRFTVDEPDSDLLLFAAGSGITPMLSIVKTALRDSPVTVYLYYANRDDASVIFAEEIASLVDEYPERLVVEHWLEDAAGLPTASSIESFAARAEASTQAMICGPAPFMSLASQTLSALGGLTIRTEEFVSIDGDPFVLDAQIDAADAADTSTVQVHLDGVETSVRWPADVVLLDALLAAGLDAPYSCREGECGSCMCLLRSGEVTRGVTDALDDDDVEDGFILACQATDPRGEVSVDFDA